MKLGYFKATVIATSEKRETKQNHKPYFSVRLKQGECSEFTCIAWKDEPPTIGEEVSVLVDMNTKDNYKVSVKMV